MVKELERVKIVLCEQFLRIYLYIYVYMYGIYVCICMAYMVYIHIYIWCIWYIHIHIPPSLPLSLPPTLPPYIYGIHTYIHMHKSLLHLGTSIARAAVAVNKKEAGARW